MFSFHILIFFFFMCGVIAQDGETQFHSSEKKSCKQLNSMSLSLRTFLIFEQIVYRERQQSL